MIFQIIDRRFSPGLLATRELRGLWHNLLHVLCEYIYETVRGKEL